MGVERGEGGKMRKWEAGPGSSQSQARGGRRGSKGSLPGSAGSREGPFQLLIGDKHHHVPGTQTEEGRHEPFVEGSGTLLLEHGEGTMASAAVLVSGRVHISRLDHVDRGGNDGGAEACPEGRSEVARKVICHEVGLQEGILDEVIGHQLSTVDNSITSNIGSSPFPESPEPFISGNGLVGINSALVSLATSSPGLSLEPNLYHIRGLSHSNSQGTCGAACQETAPDASICERTMRVWPFELPLIFCLSSPNTPCDCKLLSFGKRIQISSCSKNSLHQTKYYSTTC